MLKAFYFLAFIFVVTQVQANCGEEAYVEDTSVIQGKYIYGARLPKGDEVEPITLPLSVTTTFNYPGTDETVVSDANRTIDALLKRYVRLDERINILDQVYDQGTNGIYLQTDGAHARVVGKIKEKLCGKSFPGTVRYNLVRSDDYDVDLVKKLLGLTEAGQSLLIGVDVDVKITELVVPYYNESGKWLSSCGGQAGYLTIKCD